MYTIGQFACICMISPKTLRFYDEIGLLKPASVDKSTGYRYYSADQIAQTEFINLLRKYGFSIDAMKELVKDKAKNSLENALYQRLDELTEEEQRIGNLKIDLGIRLENMKNGGDFLCNTKHFSFDDSNVKVTELVHAIKVVGVSANVPLEPVEERMKAIDSLIEKYFSEKLEDRIVYKKVPGRGFAITTGYNDNSFDYIFGAEVTSFNEVPNGFVTFEISAGKYADMTFGAETKNKLVNDVLFKAYQYMHDSWFPKSGYQHAGTMDIEVYDQAFNREINPQMELYKPLI